MNYDQILIKNRPVFLGFFNKKCNDYSLSQDLFQDLFIRVRKNLKKENTFQTERVFISWVYRVAHSLFIDYIRVKNRDRKISVRMIEEVDILNMIPSLDRDPEEDIIHVDFLKEIKVSYLKLKKEQKEVFDMRVFKNMSFKEIAEETGRGQNTVLGQMRYARRNIRKKIA